jgi:hypothetical protein
MAGLRGVIDEIIPLVLKGAPTLASVLGSPFASVGVSLLEQAFGVNSNSPNGLGAAISADPDAATKLKALEFQHAEALSSLANADRSNARASNKTDRVPAILAFAILILYTIIQLTAIYIPGSQDDVISARVQDILLFVMAYYFGSSNPPLNAKPPNP